MDIILAYAWHGHAPDSRLSVDRLTARRLIRDGRARPAPDLPAGDPTDSDELDVATRSPMFTSPIPGDDEEDQP